MDGKNEERWSKIQRMRAFVDQNHRDAIAIIEMLRIPTYDGAYLQRFNRTYSAHGLEIIRSSLHQAGILCLTRLWDKDKTALSIPNIAKLLEEEPTRLSIISRRRAAHLSFPEDATLTLPPDVDPELARPALVRLANRDADRAELHVTEELEDLRRRMNDSSFLSLLESLVNLRNKLAHPLEITRREEKYLKLGEIIAPPNWGDLESAVDHSGPIVATINLFVDDLSISPADTHKVWRHYSHSFWHSVASGPK